MRSLPGPVAAAYEAGPTGFMLARALRAGGVRCEVLAPSKLQRPVGERVKTDARDALHIAKLLRLGEIVAVTIPSESQEAARDLVRAREDARRDLMSARHRLGKLLGGSRSQGGLTRTGNAHARRLLVEAAWHHRPRYAPTSPTLRARWALASSEARDRAHQGNLRLHRRWRSFEARGKRKVVANAAVARELAGWCWSLAVMES